MDCKTLSVFYSPLVLSRLPKLLLRTWSWSTVLGCDARSSRLFNIPRYRALFPVGFVSALRVSGGGGSSPGFKIMAQKRVWAVRASEIVWTVASFFTKLEAQFLLKLLTQLAETTSNPLPPKIPRKQIFRRFLNISYLQSCRPYSFSFASS